MPFVALNDVKHLISDSVIEGMSDVEFAKYEKVAADMVSRITKIDVPATAGSDEFLWVHEPIACIIQYLAAVRIGSQSKELSAEFKAKFDWASDYLYSQSVNTKSYSLANCAPITGIDRWL